MHPPRSVAGAWDPSYNYYHDPILAGGAAHFKQESPELDGAASAASAALLQYSSRLSELPQLESPPLPNQGSHRALADGEGDTAAATDWRALDRFVASQLIPADEEHAGQGLQQEYCGTKPLGTHTGGDNEDATDMVALLLLDGAVRHEEAGLLGSVADPACLHKNAARYGIQHEP
ncbi:hypothetical protein BAE44_0014080 [Dichanthelium oligosanthes]|uniref:Uncharacterized protein n=1 Tax=Dichanthelium oligosanthes TaxID=888268 RepID=A0A1E5VID2_9POAL|nr:hypothetical protein BAE44_0014080 [Dichanthelium oligosanthes]